MINVAANSTTLRAVEGEKEDTGGFLQKGPVDGNQGKICGCCGTDLESQSNRRGEDEPIAFYPDHSWILRGETIQSLGYYKQCRWPMACCEGCGLSFRASPVIPLLR